MDKIHKARIQQLIEENAKHYSLLVVAVHYIRQISPNASDELIDKLEAALDACDRP